VRVERRTSEGDEALEGTVAAAGPDTVEIASGDGPVAVSYTQIITARQVLPW
jgi:hypothetical protein